MVTQKPSLVWAMLAIALLSAEISALASERAPASETRIFSSRLLFRQPNASEAARLSEAGAHWIEDYDSFSLFSAPASLFERVKSRAAEHGLSIIPHDLFDTVYVPGGIIRVGEPLPPDRWDLGSATYRADEYGLYIIHFIGPPRATWLPAMGVTGAIEVQALIANAYLIAATPEIANAVQRLPFVQRVLPYHAFLKGFPSIRHEGRRIDVVIEVADAPGAPEQRARIRAMALDYSDGYGPSVVAGTFPWASLLRIIQEPLVVGISPRPRSASSDERATQSATTNTTSSGVNIIPTSPGNYASWLIGATRCSFCGALAEEGFRVGIADTGLDSGLCGQNPQQSGCSGLPALHSDFNPTSRVIFGTNFIPQTSTCNPGTQDCDPSTLCPMCDGAYHGTAVAGFTAGRTTDLARTDSGSFFLGTGLAPSGGLVITKIANSGGIVNPSFNIYHWAADATSRNAFIQNHSHNEYHVRVDGESQPSMTGGQYSIMSRQFDRAVRGLNDVGPAFPPITLTVSSGNFNQDIIFNLSDEINRQRKIWSMPPGTAKNVIAVGAAENVRTSTEAKDCTSPPAQHASLHNIWNFTKHGARVASGGNPWDTYIKPDLIAPAANVTSALSSQTNLLPCARFLDSSSALFSLYMIRSGTSFAAPLAAGGALIASRVYAQSIGGTPDPSTARPSLLKAMLIGSSRSMRGGTNYAVYPSDYTASAQAPIGIAPNDVQGFGRLNIDDFVSQTPSKQYVNETVSLTSSGARWSRTYPVDESSKPVKIVLAWSDVAAPADINKDVTVETLLVNDLNLQVLVGNGAVCTSYYGNNISTVNELSIPYSCGTGQLDTKNNVEKTEFVPEGVERFTIVVEAARLDGKANPALSTVNQDFSLFVYNAAGPVPLPPPTNFSRTGSGNVVTLSWDGVQGAAGFEVWRGPTSGSMTKISGTNEITALTFTDASAAANNFYVYKVRAVDPAANAGTFSPILFVGTGTTFSDDPLVAGATIRAMHVSELRQRINEMRTVAGLVPYSFVDSLTPSISAVRGVHIEELRGALNEARQFMGASTLGFTDQNLQSGATIIKAVHIQELRTGCR
jgi:hypothetical protein